MKEYIVHVPKHLETNEEEIVSFFGEPIIELIRCKDCKYRITANCERFGIKRYTQSDSFCSWAEPKEADG